VADCVPPLCDQAPLCDKAPLRNKAPLCDQAPLCDNWATTCDRPVAQQPDIVVDGVSCLCDKPPSDRPPHDRTPHDRPLRDRTPHDRPSRDLWFAADFANSARAVHHAKWCIAAGVVALTWNENEVDRSASPGLGQLATTFELMSKPLEVGQPFPTINAKDMDGNAVDLSSLGTGSWTVVLFYRGHW